MLTPGVDPLLHFISRPLMRTTAGSSGQHVASDRIFQHYEEKPGLIVKMATTYALVVELTRSHRKIAFLRFCDSDPLRTC